MTIEAEVLAAADGLVANFGGGRVEEHFARRDGAWLVVHEHLSAGGA
jgi:hypothetical protein